MNTLFRVLVWFEFGRKERSLLGFLFVLENLGVAGMVAF